jgi:hypothetical protein
MKSNIMKRAHQIAKNLEGDYRARMSLALRQAWKEEKEGKGLTVEELVKLCEIIDAGDGRLGCRNKYQAQKHLDELKTKREEILKYLADKKAAEKAAAEAREAKINAIEGLKELKAAINEQDDYYHEINRRFENEALSSILPTQPTANIKELKEKYPRAAAYIKAENWKYANNYAKAAAGKKALERIINGENYEQALADMEAEWSAHCQEHMWD